MCVFKIHIVESFCTLNVTTPRVMPKTSALTEPVGSTVVWVRKINPLKTKRRLLYLKTQFVPRSKHFSSRL